MASYLDQKTIMSCLNPGFTIIILWYHGSLTQFPRICWCCIQDLYGSQGEVLAEKWSLHFPVKKRVNEPQPWTVFWRSLFHQIEEHLGGIEAITDLHVPVENVNVVDHYHMEYVVSFLMGLSVLFAQLRGQLLLMDPIPLINKVFALVS